MGCTGGWMMYLHDYARDTGLVEEKCTTYSNYNGGTATACSTVLN